MEKPNCIAEIDRLKARIKDLEVQLIASNVKQDMWMEVARQKDLTINNLQQRVLQLEQRNQELENPRGSHYHTLSWQAKVVFCIRKLKRPLRLQEIKYELEIMEAPIEGLKYQGDNFISVVVAKAVKQGQLHIEKVPGTRGAYYALKEWVNEDGQLNLKMKRWLI